MCVRRTALAATDPHNVICQLEAAPLQRRFFFCHLLSEHIARRELAESRPRLGMGIMWRAHGAAKSDARRLVVFRYAPRSLNFPRQTGSLLAHWASVSTSPSIRSVNTSQPPCESLQPLEFQFFALRGKVATSIRLRGRRYLQNKAPERNSAFIGPAASRFDAPYH